MRRIPLAAALLALALAGCGSSMARVKGQLVENGQPKGFPPTTASVQLTLMDGAKADLDHTYNAVVNQDGTFEVAASGGQLQPGTYQVAVLVIGKLREQYGHLAPEKEPLTREIKPGLNTLTIELAKGEKKTEGS
jgi:hypothetical protein